ncbi:uncharacterized protein B0I36DRAFT_353544 [Microdochium trichocladiopsis]|uniref:BTB domain-containing protein n=1 Tax=Microdochium trichocladiopsis TaxID=1682393 RepID=A0A9P9BHQ9_9PEZI|nr:uncharacterized protein B0I36DRAFT_353544 [Microdochium trichocladiopsis]KAH7020800.1 hypothetical protein B0I36DRAFT_353544 [Microdochium trichocladiopsis]
MTPTIVRISGYPVLTLKVIQDNRETLFEVQSSVLQQSGRYFEGLLGNNFIERRPRDGEPWIVDMHEIDSNVIEKVLRFLHDEDPAPLKDLPEDELVNLVELIDFLQCHKVFHYLAISYWAARVSAASTKSLQGTGGQLLYVALHMDLDTLVKELLDGLQHEVNNSQGGASSSHTVGQSLCLRDGTPLMFHPCLNKFNLPVLLMNNRDKLWAAEAQAKAEALELYYTGISPYFPCGHKNNLATCQKNYGDAARKMSCYYALSGFLMHELMGRGLEPGSFTLEAQASKSAEACFDMLDMINLVGLQYHADRHNSCNPIQGLRDGLRAIRQRFEAERKEYDIFPMPEYLEQGMQKRRWESDALLLDADISSPNASGF